MSQVQIVSVPLSGADGNVALHAAWKHGAAAVDIAERRTTVRVASSTGSNQSACTER